MNIAPYTKAVASGVGNAITFGTGAVALLELAPPDQKWAAEALVGLLAVLHAANTFHVWLVKNEQTLQDAVDMGTTIVQDVEQGRHALGSTPPGTGVGS